MCRFKINTSLSSFEAITGEQLGPIDGVSLKEIRLFDKKAIYRQETASERFR